MALYLYEASYSDESWAAQLKKRENVLDRIRPLGKALNVDVKDAWYSLGEHDILVLAEAPDAETAAAFSLAVAAGGSTKSIKTTSLLTVAQGQDAMKRAFEAAPTYHAPVTA